MPRQKEVLSGRGSTGLLDRAISARIASPLGRSELIGPRQDHAKPFTQPIFLRREAAMLRTRSRADDPPCLS